jgi:CBS domain-containing protein
MMNEPLRSIMTTKVITLTPESPLSEARKILLEKRVHHLPVVENKKLVGILTTWDLFKMGKAADDYEGMKTREVMTTHLATLNPDDHIGAAAEVLKENLFQAVPIVNDALELEGIVTTFDLLGYEYGKEYPPSLDKFVAENM